MAGLVGRDTWPVWAVLLVGVAFRLYGFNEYWLNPDEGIYYSMVTWDTWSQFYGEYSANAHPPLFYVLLRLLGYVSLDIGLLRGISFVCGCACAPAVCLFARECVGRDRIGTWTGVFAGLVVAVSGTSVEMSQIIRPYTLQFASFAFGLWFLVRFLRRGERGALPYATCMVIAVLTHYATLLMLAGLAATGLAMLGLRFLSGEQFRRVLLWNVPVLLAALGVYFLHIRPNLEGSSLAKEAYESWLEPLMIQNVSDVWPKVLAVLSHIGKRYEGPLLLVLVAGIVLAMLRRQALVALFPLAALAVSVAASAAHKYPVGYSRHSLYLLLAMSPALGYALAVGLATSWRIAIPTAVLVAALAVFHHEVSEGMGSELLYRRFENTLTREDYDSMREMIDVATNEEGIILMSLQTFCLLMPEFREERQQATFARDESMRRFRWKKAEVVVSRAWGFSMERKHLGKPIHLYDFSDHVDRMFPDLQLTRRRRITMMAGGWSNVWKSIKELRDAGGQIAALVGNGKSVSGLIVIEIDLAGYRALVHSAIRRR